MDYSKLGKQFIGGEWRDGKSGKTRLTSIHIMMRSLRLFKSRALQTLMMPISLPTKLSWNGTKLTLTVNATSLKMPLNIWSRMRKILRPLSFGSWAERV